MNLIKQINEFGLSEIHWKSFNILSKKREEETLTDKEHEELLKLIKEEEELRLKRIILLGQLSKLKNVPLKTLCRQMGINTPNA